jgi:endonuclease/exonuclease/phosphatase (EEP) superfamily protein YafD
MGAMEAARSEPAAAQGRSTGRALRAFRRLGWLGLAAFLSAAALVLSARFFWLGEVAVNFSWHMGWAGLLGALLLYLVRLRLAAGVTLVGAWLLLAPELWLWVPASHPKGAHDSIAAIPVGRRLTVVSCNRLAGADNLDLVKLRLQELAHEYGLGAEGFDVVAIQEGNVAFLETLDAMRATYPYQAFAPPREQWNKLTFGTAILSRWPMLSSTEFEAPEGLVRGPHEAVLDWNGVPLKVRNAHPMRPGKAWRNELRFAVLETLKTLVWSGPAVLCGDLNMTSQSPQFTALTGATGLKDSRQGFGRQPSFFLKTRLGEFGMPIDHILVSDAFHVVERRTFDIPRSDHDGVVAVLEWVPGP